MPSKVTLITNDAKYKQAPRYTIGFRPDASRQQVTPGPGAYNNDKFNKARAWSIGKSNREMKRCSSAPGPGDYKTQDATLRRAPGYGFGSAVRSKSMGRVSTPGPGNYTPNWSATKAEPPKFTAPPRRDGAGWESNPPVGGENKWSGGKRGGAGTGKQSRPSSAPGPGHYNARKAEDASHVPAATFGSAPRDGIQRPKTPGPGTYKNSLDFGQEASAWTMGKRADQTCGQPTPGPGGYIGVHTQFA